MNKLYQDMIELLEEIKRNKNFSVSSAEQHYVEKTDSNLRYLVDRIETSIKKNEYKKFME